MLPYGLVVPDVFWVPRQTQAELPTGANGTAGGSIQNGPRRLRQIKGLQWQTLVRGDIGRQRLFRPLANPGEVEASCIFRALMRYEVKQHDFKMFGADS